jgi:hypothetical protein
MLAYAPLAKVRGLPCRRRPRQDTRRRDVFARREAEAGADGPRAAPARLRVTTDSDAQARSGFRLAVRWLLFSRHPHFARIRTLLALTNDDSRILPDRKLAEDRLYASEHLIGV